MDFCVDVEGMNLHCITQGKRYVTTQNQIHRHYYAHPVPVEGKRYIKRHAYVYIPEDNLIKHEEIGNFIINRSKMYSEPLGSNSLVKK